MFAANASGPGAVGNNGGPNGMGSPSRIDHSAGRGPGLRHVLAGLQAGVLGALLIFACLMLGSPLERPVDMGGAESLRHYVLRQRCISQPSAVAHFMDRNCADC